MPNGVCFSPDESLALHQRHAAGAHQGLRRERGRLALERPHVLRGSRLGRDRGGDPGRDEVRRARQHLGHGTRRIWVISAEAEHLGVIEVPENTGNLTWGGDDWTTLFIPSSTSLYAIRTKVGPRREPYMRWTMNDDGHRAGRRSAAALIIQDLQNDVIIEGGAFADGAPGAREEQNVVENVKALADGLPQGGRAGDPRLVHRRAGRARPEAERAALPGRQGRERARARHLGRRPGGRPRAAGRRPRRREDADERVPRHEARASCWRARPRHDDRHRRLDEHVDRAHRAPRAPTPASARSSPWTACSTMDDEWQNALDQLRAAERLDGDHAVR